MDGLEYDFMQGVEPDTDSQSGYLDSFNYAENIEMNGMADLDDLGAVKKTAAQKAAEKIAAQQEKDKKTALAKINKAIKDTSGDIKKINAEVTAGRLSPDVALPYTAYMACLNRRLSDISIVCSEPTSTMKQIMAMAKVAKVQAKTDAKVVKKAAAVEKKTIKAAATALKKEVKKAAVAQKKADKEAKKQMRLKDGKTIMAAPSEVPAINEIQKKLDDSKKLLAAKKAELQRLKTQPKKAPAGRAPAAATIAMQKRPLPAPRLKGIEDLDCDCDGLSDDLDGMGDDFFPGFSDPTAPVPGLNPLLDSAAFMPAMPPMPTPTVPTYCQGKVSKKNQAMCLFASMTLETQKQTQWMMQQLFAINQELMSVLREISAYQAGGGAGTTTLDPAPYDPNLDPYYGNQGPPPPYYGGEQPYYGDPYAGGAYGAPGGMVPQSGGEYTEIMESGGSAADSTGNAVMAPAGGGFDFSAGDENPMMMEESSDSFNITPAQPMQQQTYYAPAAQQQTYAPQPMLPAPQFNDQQQYYDEALAPDLEDASYPEGDADFPSDFSPREDEYFGAEDEGMWGMGDLECCEVCSAGR